MRHPRRPGRDSARAVGVPGAAPTGRTGDGDGWTRCVQGHEHWGLFGAAGVAVVRVGADGAELLMQHRALWSHHGGTWGIPGGARDSGEDALTAALRECSEEVGALPDDPRVLGEMVDDHGGWSYTTVVLATTAQWRPHPANAESTEVAWVPVDRVHDRDVHPGLAAGWDRLAPLLRP